MSYKTSRRFHNHSFLQTALDHLTNRIKHIHYPLCSSNTVFLLKQVPSVQKTIQPMDKLAATYDRYATGKAKTEVADAIRQGTTLP